MYTALARASLSTGEPLEIGAVETGGEASWQPQIEAMLGHKSAVNRLHIAASFRGPLDDLQTLFYLGTVAGELVTISMLAGAHGAAIYGHVFTLPAWRRRGAAAALHRVLAADWRRWGYRVVTLSADVDGHARRLYEAVGFRVRVSGRGDMIWSDGFPVDGVRDGGGMGVGPVRWGDWGWISEALSAEQEATEELPRSMLFRAPSARYVDWLFIAWMMDATGEKVPGTGLQVLRYGRRAVGWAARLPGSAGVLRATGLEVYLRPGARSPEAVDALLAALPWFGEPTLHTCTAGDGYRAQAFRRWGFVRQAALPRWWDMGRGPEPAVIWTRAPGRAAATAQGAEGSGQTEGLVKPTAMKQER